MESSVDSLHLSVRAPRGREALAGRAEQFNRDVLEAFSRMVESRMPGRVVLLRRVSVRWSLTETELADPTEVDARAGELADTLPPLGIMAAPNDTAAVFEDEAAWFASYLRQRSAAPDAAPVWFHGAWQEAERTGAPPSLETARTALARLEAAGDLTQVLKALPHATLAGLASTLGAGTSVDAAVHSFATHLVGPGLQCSPLLRSLPDVTSGTSPFLGSPPSAQPGAIEALDSMREAVAEALQRFDEAKSDVSEEASFTATRFGGLFYLLSLTLELGVGEALWKACLPEGVILAHAARCLPGLDTHGDPAALYFGGVTRAELAGWFEMTPEQHAEAAIELMRAAAVALARTGGATIPAVTLQLMDCPAGRLLVACLPGPFVIFGWSAPDARAAVAGVDAFLSVWPASYPPPRAPDVLVARDSSMRLKSLAGPAPTPTLPEGPLPVAALAAQIAGIWGALVAFRSGEALAGPSQLVSRFLTVPAHIVLEPEGMTVRMPMDAIEMPLRRAGLDRDPGWVPWLRRSVRIEFMPSGHRDVL